MTTTPDPATVREIARAYKLDDDLGAEEFDYAVRRHTGYDMPDEEFQVWREAVDAAAMEATVTKTVSWPDEQPQDDQCAWHELRLFSGPALLDEGDVDQHELTHPEQCRTLPPGAACWAEHRPFRWWWPTAHGTYRIRPEDVLTGGGEDGPEYQTTLRVQVLRDGEWFEYSNDYVGANPADETPAIRERLKAELEAKAAEQDGRDGDVRAVTGPATLVAEFHTAFDLPRADRPVLILDTKISDARQRLLEEEVAEVAAATAWDNLPGIAQELADVVYVAYGTALTYGIDLDAVMAEVHRANMAKLGPDGRPTVVDGKVVKPEGWQKPNVAGVLAALDARDAKTTVKRTPEQWCEQYDVDIADSDGWRSKDAPAWAEPITLAEFYRRARQSTVRNVPDVDWQRIARDAKAEG